MDTMPRLGCLVFDDPAHPARGWMALGEEQAVRFEGESSLPGNACFLTNIPYAVYKEGGGMRPHNFFTADYLHEDLSGMSRRFRLEDQRCLAELGAKLTFRVLALSRFLLEDPAFLPQSSLRRGLLEKLGLDDAALSPQMAGHIEQAVRFNTNCQHEGRYSREDVGSFLVPGREHCLAVLDQILPYGRFMSVPPSELPAPQKGREGVMDFVRSQGRSPGFFCLSVDRLDAPYDRLLNLANRLSSSQGTFWVASPELSFLAPLADLEIHAAFVSSSSLTLKGEGLFVSRLEEVLPAESELSLTASLFFENYWHGLCGRWHHNALSQTGLTYVNPLRAFFYAKDQTLLCAKARLLTDLGVEVVGYANGRVRANLRELDQKTICQIAAETGLIPPMLTLASNDLPSDGSLLSDLRSCMARGDLTTLLFWDREIISALLDEENGCYEEAENENERASSVKQGPRRPKERTGADDDA